MDVLVQGVLVWATLLTTMVVIPLALHEMRLADRTIKRILREIDRSGTPPALPPPDDDIEALMKSLRQRDK
jgi:hypothetical protein